MLYPNEFVPRNIDPTNKLLRAANNRKRSPPVQETLGAASALVRLTFLVQTLYVEVGRGCELTQAQAQLLCSLRDRSVGMAELSGMLGLERSSLTGLVDRAQQRGLVVRENDPQDRRAVKVTLTEDGTKALHRFHHELTRRLDDLLDDLPATERERFSKTLGRVVAGVPAVFAD
jgi:DNA-binding MarR family transcriptional regulator